MDKITLGTNYEIRGFIQRKYGVAVKSKTAFVLANATSMDKIEELLLKWTKSNGIVL